jgi:prepilin-type N-terminal cleavage/methylation domain-containing protein
MEPVTPAYPAGDAEVNNRAFTLIELLIVVAIIAILAAIAVPNFLEAQTRAKVSRVKADLRSVATGIEAYCVDANKYPPNDFLGWNVLPYQLSTPVAYMTDVRMKDPFRDKDFDSQQGAAVQFYTYQHFLTPDEFSAATASLPGSQPLPLEIVDVDGFNPGVIARHGSYMLLSPGPDRLYSGKNLSSFAATAPVFGLEIPYDPTNGTISFGNVMRTQRSPEVR